MVQIYENLSSWVLDGNIMKQKLDTNTTNAYCFRYIHICKLSEFMQFILFFPFDHVCPRSVLYICVYATVRACTHVWKRAIGLDYWIYERARVCMRVYLICVRLCVEFNDTFVISWWKNLNALTEAVFTRVCLHSRVALVCTYTLRLYLCIKSCPGVYLRWNLKFKKTRT